ncbi:hypothetical protein [Halogranum rubrum]|uniref:Membrane protein 6-pyruvoyl-tetrahydropterin synthase-related domain-containing protein n=1 Tax=Halogranum salarium B-1 TaxID=1210908 RepID=J2ZBN7_9EURY|nr:hypothetical protein [Halogranum salarium]EJN58085.1 hypothetical protein HSB1_35020 [Halogranum salarium B-1]
MSERSLPAVDGLRERLPMSFVSSSLPLLAPFGYFTALSLAVFFPLLEPGYVLSLDMVFAPNADYVQFGLHTKGPLYYGRLPFLFALDALALVVDDWLIQKAVLLAIPVLCGLSMTAACDARTRTGALFAGTLYAVNPFVYVRLLAGHWYFLLGYAFAPLAVVAIDRFLADEERSLTSLSRAVGWTTLVSVFDPHATVLVALGGCCLFAVRAWDGVRSGSHRRSRLAVARRFGTFCLAAAAVNAYWLLPAVVAAAGGGTHLTTISGADLTVFSARGTIVGNVPLSVAMLYGFWRGGVTTTAEFLAPVVAGLLFAVLLFLVVSGAVRHWGEARTRGVALAGLFAFVLSLGVSTPLSEPLFETLTTLVPPLRGMRDSQKFVGLLVFGYAFFGARGVDGVVSGVRAALPALDSGRDSGRLSRLALLALVCLTLLTPLVYTAPMVAGLDGQLDSTTYPESWHAANEFLGAGEGERAGRTLFLPWHGYLSVSWADGRIASPAPLFFDRPVVTSQRLDVGGIDTRATDPTHRRVNDALADQTSKLDEELAAVGVEYVILAHEADYRRYDSLDDRDAFSVAFTGDDITVYENDAYEASSKPWPRAGPSVPTTGLAVGSLVSLCSILAVAFVVRRR